MSKNLHFFQIILARFRPLGSCFETIFLLWIMVFWTQSSQSRLSQDGMTYAALAKHILSSGDWRTLHYSSEAYANFYQHPPLMIWATAGVFSLFGASDLAARILPCALSLLNLYLVYLWGRQKSQSTGFVAALLLLTSTRFVKHGSSLLLDGMLTSWMLGFALFLHFFLKNWPKISNFRRIRAFAFLGFLSAGALITKGMPALLLPAVAAPCLLFKLWKSRSGMKAALIGVILAVGTWALAFEIAGGGAFWSEYWSASVSPRLGGVNWANHAAFGVNLINVYWPWLPFWLWSLFKPWGLAQIFSLGIFLGFSATGNFLEHYSLCFYPFAALCIAFSWDEIKIRQCVQNYILPMIRVFVWALPLILMVFPVHFHGQEDHKEYRKSLIWLSAQESGLWSKKAHPKLYLSKNEWETWRGLAFGLWYSPWDVVLRPPLEVEPPIPGQVQVLVLERDFYDAHQEHFQRQAWVRLSQRELPSPSLVVLKRFLP